MCVCVRLCVCVSVCVCVCSNRWMWGCNANFGVYSRSSYNNCKTHLLSYESYTFLSHHSCPAAEGQANIKRAFKYLEGVSCLRFPEKTATVFTENGLTHSNYLRCIVPDEGGWGLLSVLLMDIQYKVNQTQYSAQWARKMPNLKNLNENENLRV